MQHTPHRSRGFTLVEVVVVMPMVVLLIGVMIAVIINLANSSIRSYERSKVQLDVLSALDRMEQDVRVSLNINSALANRLELTVLATDVDPLNPKRRLIEASTCSVATSGLSPSEALTYTVEYALSGGSLVRRVTMSTTCSSAWQKAGTETLINNTENISLSVAHSSLGGKKAADIKLIAERKVSNRNATFTGSMFARSSNNSI